MATTINRTMDFYDWAMELKDPRVDDWLLMKTPHVTAIIFALYLLVVWVGPAFMRDKQPLQLKTFLIPYNLGLVCLSVYTFFEFLVASLLSNYSYKCQPVDYSNSELALRMAGACWLFFFSKIIELLDTVLIILRKKDEQVTFLHVYHHCTMLITCWLGARFVPGGQAWFAGMLNSFVHILMYSYYALAAIGPHMQKYLWWKRYLTRIQLAQFIILMIHTGYNILVDCNFPQRYNVAVFLYSFSLVILFGNFYYQTYNQKLKHNEDLKARKAL